MGGFMKGILVKRLESSFYAFRKTLGRFIESYERFIDMMNTQGEVWISKKVDVYDLIDNGETDKLLKMVEEDKGLHFTRSQFKSTFIIDLSKDLNQLRYLKTLWDSVTIDPKLETFCRELDTNKKLLGNKKIIFTESKETAEYLEKNLKEIYGKRVVAFSGASSAALKAQIEDSFNPKYASKENDRFDVLITTDILAEGINLHRSNALINYDLPWNPTRIMQRVGRINRVGTEHEQIYVFNFFPTKQSSQQMPLKDRILEKLQAFHDTLGDDYKYLSDEEVVSPQKLFENLNADLNSEEESNNPELEYLQIIRRIRDNDHTLFDRIKKLPRKSKTGRYSAKVSPDATITFIRKGAEKDFFITGSSTRQISFIEAIRYIECEPDEEKINVGRTFYQQYEANSTAFDVLQFQDQIVEVTKAALRGNDAQVVKVLRAVQMEPTLTDDQEEKIDRLLRAYENGDIPQNISKSVVKALKNSDDRISAYYAIINEVPDEYLYERKDAVLHNKSEKQVVLSEYLKGNKA